MTKTTGSEPTLRCLLALCLLVLPGLAPLSAEPGPRAAQGTPYPLKATLMADDTADRAISIALTNLGEKPITAWSLRVTVSATGATGPLVSYFEDDGFLIVDQRDRGVLDPGGTRTVVKGVPSGVKGDVEVHVVAVVFEDVTTMGDEDRIELIFSRRQATRDELARWLTLYKDRLVAHAGSAALPGGEVVAHLGLAERNAVPARTLAAALSLKDSLAALGDLATAVSSQGREPVSAALQRSIEQILTGPGDPRYPRSQQIAMFAEVLDVAYANATQHSRRPK